MTNGNAGKQYLAEYCAKTQSLLEAFFCEKLREAKHIGQLPRVALEHFMTIALKGKRIRGALFCLGFEAAGGEVTDDVLRASLSVELFHTGGLVQDDIVDRDETRRGLPALHKELQEFATSGNPNFGDSLTIFMGDIAMFYSYELIASSTLPASRVQTALGAFSRYASTTCYGQILDIANTFNADKSEKDILSVMRWKTCEYTGVMPLMLGAILAGCADKEKLRAFERYGQALGWAFQIQDDILGMFGDEKVTGKPVGNDMREGKYTLLMLHLTKHGSDKQKQLLTKFLGNKGANPEDVSLMQHALKNSGAYDHVLTLGERYVEEGRREIPRMTLAKDTQAILSSLLSFMLERMK